MRGGHESYFSQRFDAGLKDHGFREVARAFVLQPVSEPRRFDLRRGRYLLVLLSKEISPSLLPSRSRPAAMIPRAGHQIVQMIRIVLFEQLVDLQRAVEILLVPPAGDIQVGNLRRSM